MSKPAAPGGQGSSTRPYLIRALHDWCTDNGFTPYVAVFVDGSVQVPTEYVKNNEIVLNIGFEATTALKLGNQFIEFKARFGGTAREIMVPVDHVVPSMRARTGRAWRSRCRRRQAMPGHPMLEKPPSRRRALCIWRAPTRRMIRRRQMSNLATAMTNRPTRTARADRGPP